MNKGKILVITDQLPARQSTAGYVLSLIHKELKLSYEILYVCLHNLELNYDVFEQIGRQSVFITEQPRESWGTQGSRLFSAVSNYIGEKVSEIDSLRIAKGIESLIHRERPIKIIYVLESKTSYRVCWKLSREIQIESIGIFWDPIDWWIEVNKTNRFAKKRLVKQSLEIARALSSTIVSSENMKQYMNNLGAKKSTTVYPYFNN
jgi:hypothetical protein